MYVSYCADEDFGRPVPVVDHLELMKQLRGIDFAKLCSDYIILFGLDMPLPKQSKLVDQQLRIMLEQGNMEEVVRIVRMLKSDYPWFRESVESNTESYVVLTSMGMAVGSLIVAIIIACIYGG